MVSEAFWGKTMNRILRGWLLCLAFFHAGLGASELSDQLSSDRYVLLMRHAHAPGVGDPLGYSLDRCETQRLLDDRGKSQAVRIGHWLRAQGVIQASVHASPWCRCRQTAELLDLGPVVIEPSLASFFDQPEQASSRNKSLQAFISKSLRLKNSRPLVLVTHHVNIREFVGQNVGSGDMVLAQVDANGRMLNYRLYPSP